MASSRSAKQSGDMADDQFQQLLTTMMAGINPVKKAANFSRTPGQASIEEVIDYSNSNGIKLWQEFTQPLPIKFKVIGGELNHFIEALK